MPVVLVLNKIDLVAKAAAAADHRADAAVARVHARSSPSRPATGEGVEELERLLLEKMPEGEALYPADYLTDQPERVLVSETVREKVLLNTRDELPFSTAVAVDQFDEPDRPGGLLQRLLHDPGRNRVAEADRHRPRRRR